MEVSSVLIQDGLMSNQMGFYLEAKEYVLVVVRDSASDQLVWSIQEVTIPK